MAKQKRPFFRVIEDPTTAAPETAARDAESPAVTAAPQEAIPEAGTDSAGPPIPQAPTAHPPTTDAPPAGEAMPADPAGEPLAAVPPTGSIPREPAAADPTPAAIDPATDPGAAVAPDPPPDAPPEPWGAATGPGSPTAAFGAGIAPAGDPAFSDPTGDPFPADPADYNQFADPAGYDQFADPAGYDHVADPAGDDPSGDPTVGTPAGSTATAAWTAYRQDPQPPEMTDPGPANPFLQDRDLGPESIAVILRNRREALGYGIEDAAGMLRIRLPYLQAIEEADWNALPGSTYAIGFVRAYAGFLGMEPEPVVTRFKEEIAGIRKRPALEFPTPEVESRVPSAAIFLVAASIAVIAYGGWYLSTRPPQGLIDSIPRLPDRFAELLGGDSPIGAAPGDNLTGDPLATPGREQIAPAEPEPAAPPADAAPDGDLTDASEAADSATPDGDTSDAAYAPGATGTALEAPAATAASTVDPPEPPPLAPQADSVWSGPSITLVGTGMSWIQIRDSAGALVMTRVLQEGDRYSVPTEPGLVLDTGNAGGLRILVGEEPVPAIGDAGQVVRSIALDPARLEAGTAIPGNGG